MLSLGSITSLMAKEGPVVSAVKIDHEGQETQLSLDMTPTLNIITKELNGKATFVGMYHDQGVVMMCVREPVEGVHKENNAELPYPFDQLKEKVSGDILAIKMSEESEPLDFTLDDWKSLKKIQEEKLVKDTESGTRLNPSITVETEEDEDNLEEEDELDDEEDSEDEDEDASDDDDDNEDSEDEDDEAEEDDESSESEEDDGIEGEDESNEAIDGVKKVDDTDQENKLGLSDQNLPIDQKLKDQDEGNPAKRQKTSPEVNGNEI